MLYGQVLAGVGPGLTLLKATGAGTFLSAHGGSPPYPVNQPGFQITGFTLNLENVGPFSVGIDFGDGSDFYIDQVRVSAADPMPATTVPIWEINRFGWTEKAFVRVQIFNPPVGSAGYIIDRVPSARWSHMYSWHEIHVSVNGPGCGVQLANGAFVQNARMFKIYGNFFQTSSDPVNNQVPLQWCLDVSGFDGGTHYSYIAQSPVQIGVETDVGGGTGNNVTQWQTIKFGPNASNKMIDCWGQLVFLDTNGWYPSDVQNGQLAFGGVIHGDGHLTTANTAPSGWL